LLQLFQTQEGLPDHQRGIRHIEQDCDQDG
jgi:hypothetical protein